jgi:fructose-1,6-bisphosphatase I/sedoheptulose-1,7-bisphosphatase
MRILQRLTLTQFLIEQRRHYPSAKGSLNGLILNVALACKAISRVVAEGGLGEHCGSTGIVNVQGETQQRLDAISNDLFIRTTEWGGQLAGLASEEMSEHYNIPEAFPRGDYLLTFDPLDGSSNIDINVTVGSIFSVLRAVDADHRLPDSKDFLQRGCDQVAAGYALYGPSTMFVISVGNGVNGFTLDPVLGEFILTHPDMKVPPQASEFAINSSNSHFWEPPVTRYVNELMAGSRGPRGKDFNMRWIASMVADAHRILVRGGVYLYPRDTRLPQRSGRLRLLYEANPVGFLIEQAGGRASTGHGPVLDLVPHQLHQRIGLVFGSREEVERVEQYHADPHGHGQPAPLFNERGLFAN